MTDIPTEGHGCPYGEHVKLLTGIDKIAVILETVQATLVELCTDYRGHEKQEGHPLMIQRVRILEENHARTMRTLDQLTESNRTVCETLHLMQAEQQSRSEDRRVQLDAQSKRYVAWLAVCGTIGAALVTAVGVALKAWGG